VETSAKNNTNIEVAFAALIRLIRKTKSPTSKMKTDPSNHDLALSLNKSDVLEQDLKSNTRSNKISSLCKCIIA